MSRTKFLSLLAILIIASLIVAACGGRSAQPTAVPAAPSPTQAPAAQPAQPLKFKVGTNAEYRPFEFVDENGQVVGFDIDLMAAIAKAGGFEAQFVNTRWDGIFVALAQGEFEAVMSAATITEERKQSVNFSDPYFLAGQGLAVKAGSPITGIADVDGKRVGVQLGTTGDIWASENTGAQVVRYDEITLAMQALANGDIDAVLNDAPVSADIIVANPQLGLVMLPEVYTTEEYGIAVNKGKPEVLEAINRGLAAVKASGEYDAIYEKWFGMKPPAAVAEAPAAPAAPGVPQTLTIASGTDIENMNIHLVTSSPSFTVLEHIYEALFYMNPEGELEPLLAESMTANDDGSFTLNLREGITFSDGVPFNAEAVKANLDWVLDTENKATFRFLIDRIQEVVVTGEYTVDLKLSGPFAPLPAHLSHGALAMVHPGLLAQGADAMAANAIGTGPFLLDSWQRDEAVTLKKNPNYWGGAPTLDTLVFKVVKEDGARLVEIEAGTADVAVRVPPAEAARLDADPNISIVTTPGLRTIYIFFNVTEEPFTDARVRQAVNYAVDVEGIVNALFDGAARVSDAPFAPAIFGYSPQTPYARDVAKAKELLAEAGVAAGAKVVLYHPTGRYIQDALVADAVRSQLRDVGLEVELKTLEWPQYVPTVRKEKPDNDVQFAMLGWGTPTMDADYALFALFHSSQHPPGFNGAFYENPEVDALLDEARTNPDQAARQQAYDEAIRIIWEDAPWLFLYSEVQLTAVRDNVQGFLIHPNERLIATDASKK